MWYFWNFPRTVDLLTPFLALSALVTPSQNHNLPVHFYWSHCHFHLANQKVHPPNCYLCSQATVLGLELAPLQISLLFNMSPKTLFLHFFVFASYGSNSYSRQGPFFNQKFFSLFVLVQGYSLDRVVELSNFITCQGYSLDRVVELSDFITCQGYSLDKVVEFIKFYYLSLDS